MSPHSAGGVSFAFRTFGCKTNQYESEGMREALLAAGFVEAPARAADYVIVNTCSVTARADAGCRNAIRQALRANPRACVVVAGCGVDLGREWPEELAGRGIFLPNDAKAAAAAILSRHAAGETAGACAGAGGGRFAFSLREFSGHTRAFLKIQDGCDNFCSYCAIPQARGRPVSRPLGEILREAETLAAAGYRELVLTGINIGRYDCDGLGLAEVLREVCAVAGAERVRLGSVEPELADKRLAEAFAANSCACPHLHLPLQSGDDRILRAMNRRYDAAGFRRATELMLAAVPELAFTTDVIVGFPGEGEEEFANTLRVCEETGFSRLHVFPFSPRPEASAAALRRTCTQREVTKRHHRLAALGEELAATYARRFLGREVKVLVEECAGGEAAGYTGHYLRASFPCDEDLRGKTVTVRVATAGRDGLSGTWQAELANPPPGE